MDFDQLLKGRNCECGMTHVCDIRHVCIGQGVIREIPALTGEYRRILLVADEHTFAACGERVLSLLGGRAEGALIYARSGLLIPDEAAVEEMRERLTGETDLILGVGSGVIQDLCKYVSFFAGLPYGIVATAPSMDGYASAGAAMILGGMKVTVSAHVPRMIIGDTDVLKDAPLEMIKAGYGDILGKYSCLNDWALSHVVRGEYFCPYVHDLTMDMLLSVRDLAPALLARDQAAVERLMQALVGVGVAMAFVGNSRPASGSEHHLSHFFEITGILRSEPYLMHGTDVAYSSVYTQMLRERLLALDAPPTDKRWDKAAWERDVKRIYGEIAPSVIALQDRMGWYPEDRRGIYREKWADIRAVLAKAPSRAQMLGWLAQIGLDIGAFEAAYGQKKIVEALAYAKDLKDRYSVLWLYNDLM